MPNVLPDFKPPVVEWMAVMPVLVVLFTGIVALILEMARPKRNNALIMVVGLIGLGAAGYFAAGQVFAPEGESFMKMVVVDRFEAVMQILLICALTLLFSEGYMREKPGSRSASSIL